MSRNRVVLASVAFLLVAVGIAVAVVVVQQDRAAKARARQEAHDRHAQEVQEHAVALVARLEEESSRLVPPGLEGVALGMTEGELRRVRPTATAARTAGDREHTYLEEDLENGAQILFGMDRRGRRLTQIQILSLLPSSEAITPHLSSMNETYGRPTGIWDCPDTEGVPTRRFTWRRSLTTVMDVFLIYRGRVSLTLYIAPSESIAQSLQRSQCHPVRDTDLTAFPVATDAQMHPPSDAPARP